MDMCRTYWNTNSLIKRGDKYIRIELNNTAPKLIVTRHSGELLEGFVPKSDKEESIECESVDLALKEAARLCEEAVHQGYYAYFLPVHGNEQFKWPKPKEFAEIPQPH